MADCLDMQSATATADAMADAMAFWLAVEWVPYAAETSAMSSEPQKDALAVVYLAGETVESLEDV